MDIENYYDKIYRYCRFRVNDKSLAEDLTQETFLRFLNSSPDEPERYLYTIARNLCIDEYRKNHEDSFDDMDEPSSDGFEDHLIGSITLRRALEKLSDEERDMLILRYVNGESVQEISKLTGLSRFAVYRRCMDAKKRLSDLLGERINE